MPATIGKDGGVVVNASTVTFIDRFTLNLKSENVDVTSYGDTARVRQQTFRDWDVDIEGTLNRADAAQAALLDQFEDGTLSAVLLQLKTGASAYWYGSAVLRTGNVRSEVAGKVSVSFSFDSAGGLNYSGS